MSIIIGLLTFLAFYFSREYKETAEINRSLQNYARFTTHSDVAFLLACLGVGGLVVLMVMAS